MDNSKMFQMQVVLGDRIFPKVTTVRGVAVVMDFCLAGVKRMLFSLVHWNILIDIQLYKNLIFIQIDSVTVYYDWILNISSIYLILTLQKSTKRLAGTSTIRMIFAN